MRRSGVFLRPAVLAALVAGCAALGGSDEPASMRAADFEPGQIRQPVILVRLELGPTDLDRRDRDQLPVEYEGALLEGLNGKAVLARDVRVRRAEEARRDLRALLARARELDADHAILVDVRIARGVVTACEEARRPLSGQATVWRQDIEVLRARDGAPRLRLVDSAGLRAIDVDVDCDDPRRSHRRPLTETIADAVDRLLFRVFGP